MMLIKASKANHPLQSLETMLAYTGNKRDKTKAWADRLGDSESYVNSNRNKKHSKRKKKK